MVTRDDETILWTGNVDKKIYTKKAFRYWGAVCLIPVFGWALFVLSLATCFICVPLFIYFVHRSADNTYLCITDKRIIKRYGVFKSDYRELPYKSIRMVNIKTSIFDREEGIKTADLHIVIDILIAVQEGTQSAVTKVSSLNHIDEANKLISSLVSKSNTQLNK